ncbi:hypothetical protein OIY81_856 [Cryptosporidium canis]|uniref:Uncharacterized protein n=1 Tax=Cryptosporidium canis TaxID=195482 RepID=A0ABQ8P7K3_9CRYT|nr:hypothetical protein OJ252_1762 [Cryptosporidium canis]KAJ1613669.1 hypothetical protein OIY81_856 [Cryptosporidium canis]
MYDTELAINLKFENDNQDSVEIFSRFNSLCSRCFHSINKINKYTNIYKLKEHFIKMLKLLRMFRCGNNCSKLYNGLTPDKKNTICIYCVKEKEHNADNILIWNLYNYIMFLNIKGAYRLNFKLLFNHYVCPNHFNTLKYIRTANKKFYSIFSRSYSVYYPPIMDEMLPICNSITNITCRFLNIFDPEYWSIQILVCVSCLLRVSYYHGVLKILTTMVSVLKNKNGYFKYLTGYGVLPFLWEGLLDMFLLLNQDISKSFMHILRYIPVCGFAFKSDHSKKFFLEERINLSIEIQNKLSNKVRIIEYSIGKPLCRKNNHFKKICHFKTKLTRSSYNSGLRDHSLKLNKAQIYRLTNNSELLNIYSKENCSLIQNASTHSRLISDKLEFKVTSYDHSIMLLKTKVNNLNFRKGDVILIHPLNKLTISDGEIMSFKQLAIILEIVYTGGSMRYKDGGMTLKLKIIDPGSDPSMYKFCMITYLLNYYKYMEKITLLRRFLFKCPHPRLTSREGISGEIFNQLISNQSHEDSSQSDKLIISFSFQIGNNEKSEINVKWMIFKQKNGSFNKGLYPNDRGELFSYLLRFKNVESAHVKKLLELTQLEKYVILIALKSLVSIVSYMHHRYKIKTIVMIIYCRKAINPKANILIISNSIERANVIKHNLNKLNIPTKILEEEYILFKQDKSKKHNIHIYTDVVRYGKWLKHTLSDKHSVKIINDLELNLRFIRGRSCIGSGLNNSFYDHLLIDGTEDISRLDILSLLTLKFSSITLFKK